MKRIRLTIIIAVMQFTTQGVFAQNITADTTLANRYFAIADSLQTTRNYDSSIVYFTKAAKIYQLAEKWQKYLRCEGKNARILGKKRKYEEALQKADSVVTLSIEKLGNNNTGQAYALWVTGNVYASGKGKYDIGLKYLQKALLIQESILPHHYVDLSWSYYDIAHIYSRKSEYDKALEYYLKSLEIFKELLGEKHIRVADSYNKIGIVYWRKSEYDKALEYLFKSFEIKAELLGEKHVSVALSYNNIGVVCNEKSEYDKALEYHFKSLEIRKKLFGKKHTDVAASYNNIGIVYRAKSEYDKALEYYFKALEIKTELLGEKHVSVARSYNNIGFVYRFKSEYDKALEYYLKSLEIFKELLGEKHTLVAASYNNIGNVYSDKSEYDLALQYYQKAATACLWNFNDTTNIVSAPVIRDCLDWQELLQILQAKAKIFSDSIYSASQRSGISNYEIALQHYQACDTLINRVRKTINTKSDKIALGEKAAKVYGGAINVCIKLGSNYDDLSFYFCEKNKSAVLSASLAQANALQFAGLSDTLVELEKSLQTEIALYKQKLAEQPDSAKKVLSQSKLFDANRNYEALTATFENNYPEYYNLKHSTKQMTVSELQKILDKKTAMISYFVGDSTITIFTITYKDFQVHSMPKIRNLESFLKMFRGLLKKPTTSSVQIYKNLGHKLYKQLFPVQFSKIIENLIIIPDGTLSTVPFETLLTEKSITNTYESLPYLIKKYNISYAYSANLWYKQKASDKSKKQKTNSANYDLLALAPVFDDGNTASVSLRTRSMLANIDSIATDSLQTRGKLLNGKSVSALPGSEDECMKIFDLFKAKGASALVKIRRHANEEFVKSDTISQYKYIHIATHGFVNTWKPELSGIVLAQDSTINEDGILYSGEIYNLKLNADLVVLSACETGLGQMKKGEGVIGLTRALMYAGANNLIVSLWKVADKSTSDLMIDFYSNMLNDKKKDYSKSLQQAKLKMIGEGKFSHPYYWSPFVLIGRQ
ncbi:MAG: tetratricopeptide repeat protein [Bacteroidales bacterium]|nr:tetratricopeptide repeat protein [Bacteroidales bacterium]